MMQTHCCLTAAVRDDERAFIALFYLLTWWIDCVLDEFCCFRDVGRRKTLVCIFIRSTMTTLHHLLVCKQMVPIHNRKVLSLPWNAQEGSEIRKTRRQKRILLLLCKFSHVAGQRGQYSDFYHSFSTLPVLWKLLCDAGNVGFSNEYATMHKPVVLKTLSSISSSISTSSNSMSSHISRILPSRPSSVATIVEVLD